MRAVAHPGCLEQDLAAGGCRARSGGRPDPSAWRDSCGEGGRCWEGAGGGAPGQPRCARGGGCAKPPAGSRRSRAALGCRSPAGLLLAPRGDTRPSGAEGASFGSCLGRSERSPRLGLWMRRRSTSSARLWGEGSQLGGSRDLGGGGTGTGLHSPFLPVGKLPLGASSAPLPLGWQRLLLYEQDASCRAAEMAPAQDFDPQRLPSTPPPRGQVRVPG